MGSKFSLEHWLWGGRKRGREEVGSSGEETSGEFPGGREGTVCQGKV